MYRETTKPMLRPNQIQEHKEEISRIEGMLTAPPHIANQIQDVGELRRQLNSLKSSLETQAPKPYAETELDAAVARERELREQWLQGMPTQAEMRRNPAGARDKHMKWEKRNKEAILEWKNIRQRLMTSGYGDEYAESTDISNVEVYRPRDSSHELNMHNEQIPGKVQFGPAPGSGPAAVMNEEDEEILSAVDPELCARMALMDNDTRRKVLEIVRRMAGDGGAGPAATASSQPAPPAPKTEIQLLRQEAKALGVNSFGKSKDVLREEIAAAKLGLNEE